MYARFFQSPNFAAWLHARYDAAGVEVRRRYLERLEVADWDSWVRGKDEDEVLELATRIEREAVSQRLVGIHARTYAWA